jgi:uncharacterized protein
LAVLMPQILRDRIESRFVLDRKGIHGFDHWTRVRENGLWLAEHTGADVAVIELFARLHDSCRRSDGGDPGHGHRAAEFALELNVEGLLPVGPTQVDLLVEACRYHSHGRTDADVTVQTCWDADRLDLGRVGTRPDPSRLCTDPAKHRHVIRWAFARSVGDEAPLPHLADEGS